MGRCNLSHSSLFANHEIFTNVEPHKPKNESNPPRLALLLFSSPMLCCTKRYLGGISVPHKFLVGSPKGIPRSGRLPTQQCERTVVLPPPLKLQIHIRPPRDTKDIDTKPLEVRYDAFHTLALPHERSDAGIGKTHIVHQTTGRGTTNGRLYLICLKTLFEQPRPYL